MTDPTDRERFDLALVAAQKVAAAAVATAQAASPEVSPTNIGFAYVHAGVNLVLNASGSAVAVERLRALIDFIEARPVKLN